MLPKIPRAMLPIVVPFGLLWSLQTSGISALFPSTPSGTAARLFGCLVMIPSMEYFARFNHKTLWHSEWLWWIHGTHHHQYPKLRSKPTYDHGNKYVSPVMEWNDVFPVVFATIACYGLYNGHVPPHSFASDSLAGFAIGAAVWGMSYFFGHDLVTHERAGKAFAVACKSRLPWLKRCAAAHMTYHHKLSKTDGDPYGPPYGFWLGPQEVKAMLANQEPEGMPRVLVWALRCIVLASIVDSIVRSV